MVQQFIAKILDKLFQKYTEAAHLSQNRSMDHLVLSLIEFIMNQDIQLTYNTFDRILWTIRPNVSPATVLNLFDVFGNQIKYENDGRLLFNSAIGSFFNSNIFPTISETCILLKSAKKLSMVYYILSEHLSTRTSLLHDVFVECSICLPDRLIHELIPLQIRLQMTLKWHRKIISENCEESLKMNLPLNNLNPMDKMVSLARELDVLQNKILDDFSYSEMKAYNFPVLLKRNKKSFVLAIEMFFSSFFECQDLYITLNDQSVLPNLTNLDPQILESFGFFLGSALILQHPLNFKLNQFYFNLLRSNYKPEFYRLLFEIYPKEFISEAQVNIKDLSIQLEQGTVKLYTGLSKALEVNFFTMGELYKLLF